MPIREFARKIRGSASNRIRLLVASASRRRPSWTRMTWWKSLISSGKGVVRRCWTGWLSTRAYRELTRSRNRPPWVTLAWWLDWWFHPILEGHEVYQDAERWALDYIPQGSNGIYGDTLKFAEKQYDQSLKLSDSLDKKCDDIIRNAGVIGAVIAAASRVADVQNVLGNSSIVVLAVFCLVTAVIVAIRARAPADVATPMEIRSALEIADHLSCEPASSSSGPTPKDVLEGALTASFHFAVTGMNIINTWKAKQLGRSTYLFCTGVALLLFLLIFPRLP